MPKVMGKKHPYTPAGRAAAKKAETMKKRELMNKKPKATKKPKPGSANAKKPGPSRRGSATRSQMGSWERSIAKKPSRRRRPQ